MDTTKKPDEATQEPELAQGSHTATYGFFEKYQKAILYSAGLFVLLTFSVTASLQGWFDEAFDTPYQGATMVVGGETITVEQEDVEVARALARGVHSPVNVIPGIVPRDNDTEQVEVYAALRRLAIHAGIEVAPSEVDRAIDSLVVAYGVEDAAALAQRFNGTRQRRSLAQLRQAAAEAMRISTYVRSMLLSIDGTDATLVQAYLDDEQRTKRQLKVAVLDKKDFEEAFKTEGVDDATLTAWIEEMPVGTRRAKGFVGDSLARLDLVSLDFEAFAALPDNVFAPELSGVVISDAQIEERVALLKAAAARKKAEEERKKAEEEEGKDGDDKNGDDDKNGANGGPDGARVRQETNQAPEVQDPKGDGDVANTQEPEQAGPTDADYEAQARVQLRAESVLNVIWSKIRDARQDQLQPFFDELARTATEKSEADRELREAEAAQAEAQAAQKTADDALAADPDNADKKAAAADAKTKSDEAQAAVAAAKTKADAAGPASEEAQKKLDEAKAAFDLSAALTTAATDDDGGDRSSYFKVTTIAETKTAAELKDLGDLGTWEDSWAGTAVGGAGEPSTVIQRTDKAGFHFYVRETERDPLKSLDEIKDKAKEEYFKEKADEKAKASRETLETALFDLAKAKIADKVKELEESGAGRVEEAMNEWVAKHEGRLQDAEAQLADLRAKGIAETETAFLAWQTEKLGAEATLASKEAEEARVQQVVDTEIEGEIKEAAKEKYSEVLADAAGQAGFEIKDLSIRRDASRIPQFTATAEALPKFVAQNASNMEVGDVSDVREDFTERTLCVIHCESESPLQISELSRRDFRLATGSMSSSQRLTMGAFASFSLEALKQRYQWAEPDLPGPGENAPAEGN